MGVEVGKKAWFSEMMAMNLNGNNFPSSTITLHNHSSEANQINKY